MNKLNKVSILLCIMALVVVGLISSCRKDTTPITTNNLVKDVASTEVITNYNDALLKIERYAAGYRPCPVGRAMGYVGWAIYETALPGMPDYKSLASNYPGWTLPTLDKSTVLNYPLALNACQATLFKLFFPSELVQITAVETDLKSKYSTSVSQAIIDASVKWGQDVANATYNWAKSDVVVHDAQVDVTQGSVYHATSPLIPGRYEAPANKNGDAPNRNLAMFPRYGEGRVFAITNSDRVIPEPLPYSEDKKSGYYAQNLEVYSRTTFGNDYDKWIAEFWSDDILGETFSPPTRWFAVSSEVYKASLCNLEKAVITNAKMGIALNDVVVACWGNKYKYDIERPIQYIRRVFGSDLTFPTGTDKWLTILGDPLMTPPFPAYPSGHSTMGGAAAEVLTAEFGIDFAMTDRCHEGRTEFNGTPRSFPNFYSMAEENALSRIPLGVHCRQDCTSGVTMGYQIGRKVNKLAFLK
ncbi:MAG TPA: vanadium-dependent haloperoxidase [Saprospiraceae bacterium]|nr:vanadium-dependent haloperoxidase [Saprospiraceae bacterium]